MQPRQLPNSVWVGIFVVVVITTGVWAYWRYQPTKPPELPDVAFAGESCELANTVVVPTPDTPVAAGKTVVWCSSFTLAWRRLSEDVAREPIRVAQAQEIADRLNAAEHTESDVANGDVLAMAGLGRKAFESRLQKQFAKQFPDRSLPELNLGPNDAATYALLVVQQAFENAFFENKKPLLFHDASGKTTSVRSFGVFEVAQSMSRLGGQVRVEYIPPEEWRNPEFVVDLDRNSQPYQVLIAKVAPKATLAETWVDVEAKRAEYAKRKPHQMPLSELIIPTLSFRLKHRFTELEGTDKQLLNPRLAGLHLAQASQTVEFRLDRKGVTLASKAEVIPKGGYPPMIADGPFLVALKKRSATRPFLLLWIATPEFMEKW
jgi:hypothetical protein